MEEELNLFRLSYYKNKPAACLSSKTECRTYHLSVCLREANVQTLPPAEITTECIYLTPLEEKLPIKRQCLPEQTTFLISDVLHWQFHCCCTVQLQAFYPCFSSPFPPIHLLIYQPALWLIYYSSVNTGKHPSTGRPASGDWARE